MSASSRSPSGRHVLGGDDAGQRVPPVPPVHGRSHPHGHGALGCVVSAVVSALVSGVSRRPSGDGRHTFDRQVTDAPGQSTAVPEGVRQTTTFKASSPVALWVRRRSARLSRWGRSRPIAAGLQRYTQPLGATGSRDASSGPEHSPRTS